MVRTQQSSMALRTWLGNLLLNLGRKLARADGRELAVDLSDHSIGIKMAKPDTDELAWDPDLYHRGCVFVDGYANPIKPVVNRNKTLEDPDTIDAEQPENEERHVEMISSSRYGDYMKQDLISQILNPKEHWRLLAYGILGLLVLQFFAIIVTLYATGGF